MLLVAAVVVVSALDWRFGWSTVPVWAVILGQVLVAVGLLGAQLIMMQNNYAGASITVEADQPLVSTGLYGVVRHPMYSATTVMMVGTPLALLVVGDASGGVGGAGACGAHPRRGEGLTDELAC